MASAKKDYETIYETTGGFGTYQLWLFIMGSAAGLISCDVMYLNFVSFNMDHWCKIDQLQHLPFEMQKAIAIPMEKVSGSNVDEYSKCSMFDLNYGNYTDEHFLNWNRSMFESSPMIACDDWTYDRSEYAYSAVNRWCLVCGKAWQSDFVSTMNILGILFGSISFGLLADRIGRKWCVVGSLAVKAVGGLLAAFAPQWGLLLVGRFINGFGSVAAYDITVMYLMEMVGPEYRSWTGEIFAVVYSVGFMLVPAYAFAIHDYSFLQVVMSAPSLVVALLYVFVLPESPRWLLVTGKTKKADSIVKFMAKVNNANMPEDFTLADFNVKSDSENKASFLDLMKNAKLRKRALVSFVLWFSNALLYYAYSLNAGSLSGSVFLNTFLLATVEIPANLLCLAMMNQPFLGRRLTNCFALMLSGIAGIISIPLIVTGVSPTAVTALAMIGKLGSTMGLNGMYIYSSEIFPTEVRAAGLGASSMCARIAGLVGPYVGGLLTEYWAPAMSTVAGVLGIVTGLFTLLLPETLGRHLDDTVNQVDSHSLQEEDGSITNHLNRANFLKNRNTSIHVHENGHYNRSFDEIKNNVDTYIILSNFDGDNTNIVNTIKL